MSKKAFVDLTHPFSADIPRWPYFASGHWFYAYDGERWVLTQRIDCVSYRTHCDAPLMLWKENLMAEEPDIHMKWQ